MQGMLYLPLKKVPYLTTGKSNWYNTIQKVKVPLPYNGNCMMKYLQQTIYNSIHLMLEEWINETGIVMNKTSTLFF